MSVKHRTHRVGTLAALQELDDLEEARKKAVYLEPAATNAELNKQFMSPAALDLKRKTKMFNPIPL